MLLYLDLNCFNRPFDDQQQTRIAEETVAIFSILERIAEGLDRLAWSEFLTLENSQHPLVDRQMEIDHWREIADRHVSAGEDVRSLAGDLMSVGLKPLDAAHVASAEVGGCDFLLTCDDRLIQRAKRMTTTVVVENPLDFLRRFEDDRNPD